MFILRFINRLIYGSETLEELDRRNRQPNRKPVRSRQRVKRRR
jgi:hypothetical protein